MRFGQHAQRTGHQQMPAFGLGAAGLLIDQQTFGIERKREGDGCAFAGIEKLESGIGGRVRPDLTPLRRLRHPGPNSRRRVGLLQLPATVRGTSTRV